MLIKRGRFYDVVHLKNNEFVTISDKSIFFVKALDENDYICKELPCSMKHTARILFSNDMSRALICDTSGNCKVYNSDGKNCISSFKIQPLTLYNIITTSENGFAFLNEDGTISEYDIENNKVSVLGGIPGGTSDIISNKQEIVSLSNTRISGKEYMSLCYLNKETDSKLLIEGKLFKWNWNKQNDRIIILCLKSNDKGYSEIIYIISSDLKVENIISVDDYVENEKQNTSYLVNAALNSDGKMLAILWENKLKVVSLNDKSVLKQVNLACAADVEWVNNNGLIISGWNGLTVEKMSCFR